MHRLPPDVPIGTPVRYVRSPGRVSAIIAFDDVADALVPFLAAVDSGQRRHGRALRLRLQ